MIKNDTFSISNMKGKGSTPSQTQKLKNSASTKTHSVGKLCMGGRNEVEGVGRWVKGKK